MKAGEQTVTAIQEALDSHQFTIHGKLDGFPTGTAPSFGGAQATGGDYMVTRPTLFLAGEAGAERATFTPAGRGGAGGPGRGSSEPRLLQPITINMGARQLWQGLLETAHEEGLT
jgi:hypothetical protein